MTRPLGWLGLKLLSHPDYWTLSKYFSDASLKLDVIVSAVLPLRVKKYCLSGAVLFCFMILKIYSLNQCQKKAKSGVKPPPKYGLNRCFFWRKNQRQRKINSCLNFSEKLSLVNSLLSPSVFRNCWLFTRDVCEMVLRAGNGRFPHRKAQSYKTFASTLT